MAILETTINETKIPTWAIHRRLYNWVLALAYKPYASAALFFLSMAEASVFPIAPDVLQIALTLEKKEKAWFFATLNSVGSVLGGLLGYLIGFLLWHLFSNFFFSYVFSETHFIQVGELYYKWSFWAVLMAAFTPFPPYKVFTIAAGVFELPILPFLFASIIGRSGRFFLVAALLWKAGDKIRKIIETYFNLLSILFIMVVLISFFLLKIL